jgi:hypothetical protein
MNSDLGSKVFCVAGLVVGLAGAVGAYTLIKSNHYVVGASVGILALAGTFANAQYLYNAIVDEAPVQAPATGTGAVA